VDKWLSRAANISIIAIAISAVFVVTRPRNVSQPQPGYQVGDTLDLSKLSLTGDTLLIATRSTCRFCTESMELYRSLAGANIVWVAVDEDVAKNRQYLLDHGLAPGAVHTQSELALSELSITPTIVAVNAKGVVRNTWVGRLPADRAAEVRSSIGSR
jgi:hypothetical protein